MARMRIRSALPTKKGAYAMDGDAWWTLCDTIENYRRNFASLSRQ